MILNESIKQLTCRRKERHYAMAEQDADLEINLRIELTLSFNEVTKRVT